MEINEDLEPTFTLTLVRLNAFLGNVNVTWRAKLSRTSSEEEDRQLRYQLVAVSGQTTCVASVSVCPLEVKLINDTVSYVCVCLCLCVCVYIRVSVYMCL